MTNDTSRHARAGTPPTDTFAQPHVHYDEINDTDTQVFIVCNRTFLEDTTLTVIPFRGIALPTDEEHSEHYAMRLFAYDQGYMRSLCGNNYEMTRTIVNCVGVRLMRAGLRQLWQEKHVSDFTHVRTVRLFKDNHVSRAHMPRPMVGWTWHDIDSEPPNYNGDDWVSIDSADLREMQNTVQDGIRSFGAFALLIR